MEDKPLTFQGLDAMIAQFSNESGAGNAQPPAAAPAVTPPPEAVPTTPATPPAAAPANTDPAAPAATPEAEPFSPDALFGAGKQNAAFAQMRVNNAAMQKTLGRIAETLGVEAKDPEAMIQALERKLNEHKSSESGIPLDMLERMDKLTQDAEIRDRENRAAEANRGFQRVKDEFKLKDADLVEFAKKLQGAGKNPFETPMDLVSEYKLLNYDTLLTKAKEEAAAAAMQRQQHGLEHSTQPSAAAPAGSPGSAKPVNSVAGLEALLRDYQ